MRGGDIVAGIFGLILVYLLVANWKGASALLTTAASGTIGTIKTLQARG